MLERLIRGSSRQPFVVLVLVFAAALFGGVAFKELRRDVFPDLSAPVFNIIVQNPSMGAEELETSIAIPLEAALSGVPATRRIRSVNQLGVSQLTIELEPDADYFRSRQFVAERVQQVAAALPPGTEPPLLSSLTGRLNEVVELSLEAEPGSIDLLTLRDLAEFEVRNRLLAVPGVAAVERLGAHLRQFQVQLDPERMRVRDVSLAQVETALRAANVNASGGIVTEGSVEWSVRAIGRIETVGDLGAVVVARRGTAPVLISDIARVEEAAAFRRGIARRGDREVVSIRVVKQFGADTMAVSAGVGRAVAEIGRGLPRGVTLTAIYDQANLVDSALGGVSRAVLIGAGFVIVVLFGLLGDVRAALLVTLTIPLSVAIAGLLLRQGQVGLNTMTLGGLAIAVGLLVDASIIVVENVVHRMPAGASARERVECAVEAAVEVGRPIVFATAIVIAVFIPLFGMHGIEGRMYGPLAGAVVASVVASLALALTLTPVASGLVLRPHRADAEADVFIVRRIKVVYAPALAWAMRHAGLVRALSLGITVPAAVLGLRIGSDFMPELDEGAIIVNTILPAEASLEEVDRMNRGVEAILREVPEVKDVSRRTGRSERTEDPMAHSASDILVVLHEDRARRTEVVAEALREAVSHVPGVSALFTTPLAMRIDEGLGGTPADLTIKVFGPDLAELAKAAETVRTLVSKVEGLEDLRMEQTSGLPQLRVSVDRPALARHGLTPGEVVKAVRVGLVGEEVSEVWRGQKRFDLIVRLLAEHRGDVDGIRRLVIDADDGTRVPLEQVARIEQTFGPGAIRREAGSRRIAVEASVAGRDLGSTAAEVREVLRAGLELPPGYFVDVGGRVENQERAARGLTMAVAFAVVVVLVLLYLALGSLLDTMVILATLPDAMVGGIVLLYLTGETWNVSSLVGLIGLFGIAVQNGLVLVTQTRALVDAGHPFEEALREASLGRVRPKLMTASTAILGLLPLLLLDLHGTEIERPLAVVMVGGLVTSTLFTLLALPTFYALVHGWRARRSVPAATPLS